MAVGDISRTGVLKAIGEHDRIGEKAFFEKYGFVAATKYWIEYEGRRYASKAIANIAQAHGMNRVYSREIRLAGGENTIVRRLRELGFSVPSPDRNPDWNRDELILTLDLYMTNPANPPGKGSKAVVELSSLMNRMQRMTGAMAHATFRNPNGVYLKMMNLRALDPAYIAQGRVGMKAGGKLDRLIWNGYQGRRSDLAADARAIREAVESVDDKLMPKLSSMEPYEGEEGGLIMRLHKTYERDRRLIKEKRKAAKAAGSLSCEVCEFDFAKTYGALGIDYIEFHHLKPVHTMGIGKKTKLQDLALLCANCHRMAHRKRIPLTLDSLRKILN